MERAVLSLTSLPLSTLSLSIAGLKRTELDLQRDAVTKALLQVRHEPKAALIFLAQSPLSASASAVLVWMARDQPDKLMQSMNSIFGAETADDKSKQVVPQSRGRFERFDEELVSSSATESASSTTTSTLSFTSEATTSKSKSMTTSTTKSLSSTSTTTASEDQTLQEGDGEASKDTTTGVKRRFNDVGEDVREGLVDSVKPEPIRIADKSAAASSRLCYQVVLLIAHASPKLSLDFLESLLPALRSVLVRHCKRDLPTNLGLLVRDAFHFIVWKLYREKSAKLFEHRRIIVRVLRAERDWAKAAKSDCLSSALDDLISVFAYVIKRYDEVDDDDDEVSRERDASVALLEAEAAQMLANQWKSCARLLVERGPCSASAVQEPLQTLVAVLADAATTSTEARLALRDVCFLIGRTDSTTRENFGQLLPRLMETSMRALRDAKLPTETHALAAAVVKTAFSTSISQAEGGSSSLSVTATQLMSLLDDKDGVSRAAVELVAELLLRDPRGSGLLEIETRLSEKTRTAGAAANDAIKRETAVQVLSRLVELRCDLSSPPPTSTDALDERLVRLLLSKLGDSTVNIRNQAARAFVSLPPRLVVPRLCALLTDKNEKRRAAAGEALCHSLALNKRFDEALRALLLLENVNDQEAAFHLTGRWVSKLDDDGADDGDVSKWTALIETTVSMAVTRASEAPLLMGFARRLGPFVVQRPRRLRVWCRCVLREMTGEGDRQHASSSLLPTVQRLAPFLLLRILPQISIDEDEDLKQELLRRICLAGLNPSPPRGGAPADEQEIKRAAVEVLARIAGAKPWSIFLTLLQPPSSSSTPIQSRLDAIVPGGFVHFANNSNNVSGDLKRAAIYGMCQSLMAAMAQRNEFGEDVFPPVAVKLVLLAAANDSSSSSLVSNNDEDDAFAKREEQKFVMGASEFLALAMVCSAFSRWLRIGRQAQHRASQSAVVVEEVNDENPRHEDEEESTVVSMIWKAVLEGGDDTGSKQRALAMGVIVATAKSLLLGPSSPPSGQHPPTTTMANAAMKATKSQEDMNLAAVAFCHESIARVARHWRSLLNDNDTPKPPSEDELFLIFTLLFVGSSTKLETPELVSTLDLALLVQICLSAIRERVANLLPTALKVIGVLLTLPSQSLVRLQEGTLGMIQTTLKGTANMDPSPEVRKLAGDIYALSFGSA